MLTEKEKIITDLILERFSLSIYASSVHRIEDYGPVNEPKELAGLFISMLTVLVIDGEITINDKK